MPKTKIKNKPLANHGFLLINKPLKKSSHGVVNYLRRVTNIKKIGHAGTLDPLATGLLILAVGREATKQINKFVKLDKQYEAVVRLGRTTKTYDVEGEVTSRYQGLKISRAKFVLALKKFIGPQQQLPPMFSAKKVKGQKLYHLARRDKVIERPTQEIKIYKIKLLEYRWPLAKIVVACSSGTYIRSLAHDLGAVLGCGAHLQKLKRLAIGNYHLDAAHRLTTIKTNNWQSHLF